MKRRAVLLLVLVIAVVTTSGIGMISGPRVAQAATMINFPDPGLEAAIRIAINKPAGDIYDTDLVSLTSLSANSKSISNLSGLQYCTNLQQLYLSRNQIADISALANLTNLRTLWLSENQIADISALSGLTSLEYLYLFFNQITDISALAGLTNLQYLSLYVNKIADISAVANLISLRTLFLSSNQIVNISALAGLSNLQRIDLAENQIADISALTNLTNLRIVEFYANHISDISPMAGLTNLQDLRLVQNEITDISALANLTNLNWLDLSVNRINSISALVTNQGFGSGDRIYLYNNYLDISDGSPDTAGIQALANRSVVVGYLPQEHFSLNITTNGQGTVAKNPNQLNYYYGMSVQLTASPASGWVLTGWSGALSGSINPITITINGNKAVIANFEQKIVVDFPDSGLESAIRWALNKLTGDIYDTDLLSLTSLDAPYKDISNLSGLEYCTNLQHLNLDHNHIADISALANLTNLQYLNLAHNLIADASALVTNQGLGPGDQINLCNNYLDISAGSPDMVDIQTLINRGVSVLSQPQNETRTLSLELGWNIVSVPLQLSDNSTGSVFPGAAGVFTWNPTTKSYVMPTTVEPNKGYWVAVTSNMTINVGGTPVDTWASDLKAGWNMVGSISVNTGTSSPNDNPDNSVVPTAYWWDPTSKSYVPTTILEPGKGYWIASVRDCFFSLP